MKGSSREWKRLTHEEKAKYKPVDVDLQRFINILISAKDPLEKLKNKSLKLAKEYQKAGKFASNIELI